MPNMGGHPGFTFSSGGGGFMNPEDLFAQFFGGGRGECLCTSPPIIASTFIQLFVGGGMFAGGDDDDAHGMGGFNPFGGPGGMGMGQGFGRQPKAGKQPRQPKNTVVVQKIPCTLEELYSGFVVHSQ